MGRWFRCPLCGHLRPMKSLDREHSLEGFNQVGLGRAKGFRYDPIEDVGIIQAVKIRIKFLYTQYFEPVIRPSVSVVPGVIVRPDLIVFPGVRS